MSFYVSCVFFTSINTQNVTQISASAFTALIALSTGQQQLNCCCCNLLLRHADDDDDDDDDGRINFNVAYSPKTARTRNSQKNSHVIVGLNLYWLTAIEAQVSVHVREFCTYCWCR